MNRISTRFHAIFYVSFLCLVFAASTSSGQTVKILKEGNLCGVQFLDRDDKVIKIISPIYEDVAMYVKTQIGGVDLGKGYLSCRFWSDTEYVEVPIDPSDPEKVIVEVIVNDKKAYIENRPIMVKQKGKWGLIKEDGSIIRPIEYNEMIDMQGFKWEGITEERLPLMLLQKDKELTLIDAFDIPVITPQWFPPYMASLKRKVDAVELFYFGNYLLVNEGGTLADTLIKVPAVKAKENGKMVVKEPAYSYEVYIYKKGKFNVINLATGKKLGSTLILTQGLWLKDIPVKYKFSFAPSPYAKQANGYLGEGFNQVFYDYNGHTYWLSFGLHHFSKNNKIPQWLNLAVGYGAGGMFGEFENRKSYRGVSIPTTERYRKMVLSLDIDFCKIPCKNKTLKKVFNHMFMIKVPFPALSINTKGEVNGHWLYY